MAEFYLTLGGLVGLFFSLPQTASKYIRLLDESGIGRPSNGQEEGDGLSDPSEKGMRSCYGAAKAIGHARSPSFFGVGDS
jgi:hypothetical protein